MGGVTAISTFNRTGLDLYGRRMTQTFDAFWPRDVALTIFAEGWDEPLGRAEIADLEAASPWLSSFKARHGNKPVRGFRWDAVRFAHKVAAVCLAARSGCDTLIWMDGDTVTHAAPDMALVDPVDAWIAWLDRDRLYPECGFFALNCRHPRHEEMIDSLEGMYVRDKLFALPEHHDSYVIQAVVEAAGVEAKSLSGSARNTSHPAVNGPLGAFLDHCKGPRKAEGKSRRGDLVRPRSEAYWR